MRPWLIPLLLLPSMLLSQFAMLPHSHADHGDHADSGHSGHSRPHFHLHDLTFCHESNCPNEGPEAPSDGHDADAIYAGDITGGTTERTKIGTTDARTIGTPRFHVLWSPTSVVTSARGPDGVPPFPTAPIYLRHLALLI